MGLIPRRLKADGNMRWQVVTNPAEEPITVDEVKDFAGIDYTAHDTLIGTMITGVRQAAEGWLGRSLVTQTVEAYLDYISFDKIVLPRPPMITLNSFQVRQFDGTAADIDSSGYYVSDKKNPAIITIHGSSIPTTDRERGGYVLNFDAGYGDAADIPAAIRLGLTAWVLDSYENRIVKRIPPDEATGYLSNFRNARYLM